MRVLVACERSGAVRRAFRALGHDAWSCDLVDADDGSPFHLTVDAHVACGAGWDMMIAHPPCTHLSVSGARYFAAKRADGRQQAALHFVQCLMDAPIERICVENPICIISSAIRKPDQIVQPWQFGHDASKATCLWLKNLPLLQPTHILPMPANKRWGNQTPSGQNKLGPGPERARLRSETYAGIAAAMATQWGAL